MQCAKLRVGARLPAENGNEKCQFYFILFGTIYGAVPLFVANSTKLILISGY